MSYAENLHQNLKPLITIINHHPLYTSINTIDNLRVFMQQHVFAVWDFMCLLKTLHSKLVSTQAPWFPPVNAQSAHLINQLLIEEESDVLADGESYQSHFETYLAAMKEVGAETKTITQFLGHVKTMSIVDALILVNTPPHVRNFVKTTFSFFNGNAHELAAAFVFGREAITQSMFQPILQQIAKRLPQESQLQLKLVQYYFNRHIALDSEEHFPKALQMLIHLCEDNKTKWQQAEMAAQQALQARIDFLDGIKSSL